MAFLKKPYPLSWHLLVLLLAAILPFFIFSAFMVRWLVDYERAASEKRLRAAAMELALAMDREVENTIGTLQILAVGDEFKGGDLRFVHTEFQRIIETQTNWLTLQLHSTPEKPLISAARPFEDNLPATVDASSVKRVFETGAPQIGTLENRAAKGPNPDTLGFAIRVPVKQGDRTVYTLTSIIGAETVQRLVVESTGTSAAEEWTRTIVDSRGTVVARSRNPERYVGKLGTPNFLRLTQAHAEGLLREKTLEGEDVYLSFFRAPLTGWTAAVVVPVSVLDAQTEHSMMIMSGVGLLLLLAGGSGTLHLSRRLERTIRRASKEARLLAEGGFPHIPPSQVQEIDQFRLSLLRTASLLRSREQERDEHLQRAESARKEAEEANQAKSQFLANMSHELRTPLGIVLGYADLFAHDMIPPADRKATISIVQNSSQQLLHLIDDILDLSRVEANKLTLELIDFSLPELVSQVVTEFKVRAREKGIGIELFSLGPIPDQVKSDPLRLRQVIHNILGNALKFSDRGNINLTLRAEEGRVNITIEDQGIGISEEKQKLLFRPFTQADNSHTRKYGGSGLGLAISKRMAQLLGGDIKIVRSIPGQGSVFEIEFQVLVLPNAQQSFPFQSPRYMAREKLKGIRVLLAEDVVDNINLIRAYLRTSGILLDVVNNGADVLTKLTESAYDLILMDIQMPEMDGYQATRIIRSKGYKLPIIALSAHALQEQKDKAMAQGFDAYLTKPIDRDGLLSLLEKYVSHPS